MVKSTLQNVRTSREILREAYQEWANEKRKEPNYRESEINQRQWCKEHGGLSDSNYAKWRGGAPIGLENCITLSRYIGQEILISNGHPMTYQTEDPRIVEMLEKINQMDEPNKSQFLESFREAISEQIVEPVTAGTGWGSESADA